MNQRELSSRGSALAFSLLELTVSLAVVGMLAAIAVPSYRGALIRARLALVQNRCHDISVAYTSFWLEKGYGPEIDNRCVSDYSSSGRKPLNPTVKIYAETVFLPDFLDKINQGVFKDPFAKTLEMCIPQKHCFNDTFELPPPNSVGCVLSSRGPNGTIERISGALISYSSSNQHMQYSPSNGLYSNGDLFYQVPEETEISLVKTAKY